MAIVNPNPTLTGQNKSGKLPDTVLAPDDWSIEMLSLHEGEPMRLATVQPHEETGYLIAGGYRKWKVGLQQNLRLRAGQRYLIKALFTPTVTFSDGTETDYTAFAWRNTLQSPGNNLAQLWQTPSRDKGYGVEHEYLNVFEVAQDLNVVFTFEFWSKWEVVAQVHVTYIGVEEVAAEYGGTNVPILRAPESSPSSPEPPPEAAPSPAPTPEPKIIVGMPQLSKSYLALATHYDKMAEQFQQMAAQYRAAAEILQPTPTP